MSSKSFYCLIITESQAPIFSPNLADYYFSFFTKGREESIVLSKVAPLSPCPLQLIPSRCPKSIAAIVERDSAGLGGQAPICLVGETFDFCDRRLERGPKQLTEDET